MTDNQKGTAEDTILRMLHRAAQPLSIILGILELTLTEDMTDEERKDWLQRSMDELLRVTATFDQLRQFVEMKKSGPMPKETRAVAHG
jgi:signal transduction histidine kinase